MTESGGAVRPGERCPWWLYLMLALALAGTGAGAGQIAVMVNSQGQFGRMAACLLENGIDVTGQAARTAPVERQPPAFERCTADYNRQVALGVAAGSAAAPAAAWLLMVAGGLAIRRRLGRAGPAGREGDAAVAARARFELWCDRAGLQGRRRPRLVLAHLGPLGAEAFTTAVPLGRPVVVVPAGYAVVDPAQFDLVVLHELAHVRARDLTWAAATWWAGWLGVPALLLAFAPLLVTGRPSLFALSDTPFGLAVVLTAATVALRAAVLRRRETSADRYAVRVLDDGGEALRAALVTATNAERSSRPRWVPAAVREALGTHPAPDRRARAVTLPADAWQTGFGLAAITGMLAMFTFQALDFALSRAPVLAGRDARLPAELAFAAAALVWSAVLVPAWSRSDTPMLGPPRWSALAGSAAGLTAGYVLRAPGSIVSVGGAVFAGHRVLVSVWFAVVALGLGVIAGGLADAFARRRSATSGSTAAAGVVAVLASAAAAAAAFATVATVLAQHVLAASPASDRVLLVGLGRQRFTSWAPALLLAAAVALGGRVPRGFRAGAGLAALAAATVGVLHAQRRTGSTDDGVYLLLAQRWWICGVAGAVTVAAVLLRLQARRVDGDRATTLADAWVTGGLVALAAGAGQFARDAVTGESGRNAGNLVSFLRQPLWLMCVTLIVCLPSLFALRNLAARAGRRSGRVRPVPVLLATGAGVLAATLAVASGATATITSAPGDSSAVTTARPPPLPAGAQVETRPPGTRPRPGRADPGRPLDPVAARAVLTRTRAVLAAGWHVEAAPATAGEPAREVHPASCAQRLARERAEELAWPALAEVLDRGTLTKAQSPPTGVTATVRLTSYRDPAAALGFVTHYAAQATGCDTWSFALAQVDGGRAYRSVRVDSLSGLAFTHGAVIVDDRARIATQPLVVTTAGGAFAAGRNVVLVELTAAAPYRESTPRPRLADLRALRTALLTRAAVELTR